MKLCKLIILLAAASYVYSMPEKTQRTHPRIGYMFAHGLGGSQANITWYRKTNPLDWSIIGDHYYSFNFPEVQEGNYIDTKKVFLAQDEDINCLAQAHREFSALKKNDIDELVLVGLSRGASTIITYVGSLSPKQQENLIKIKALVLESPFDSVEHIIDYQVKQRYLGWVPGLRSLVGYYINYLYPSYNKFGIKPIDAIVHIDKKMPILIVHSGQDGLIHEDSSIELFRKAKGDGFENIHLVLLNSGKHARYQRGTDAFKYKASAHAFYERYGIDHDPKLAQAGRKFLLT